MTEALMRTYQKLLDEDPRDPEVLFRRADEYYKLNDYVRALDDINNAIKFGAETKDFDMRLARQLRANILMMLHKDEQALADLNYELEADPMSYVATYQRATALYNLERYAESKAIGR